MSKHPREIYHHVCMRDLEKKFFPIINSKSLPERYFFENGGREYLLNKFGLSSKDIFLAAKSLR